VLFDADILWMIADGGAAGSSQPAKGQRDITEDDSIK